MLSESTERMDDVNDPTEPDQSAPGFTPEAKAIVLLFNDEGYALKDFQIRGDIRPGETPLYLKQALKTVVASFGHPEGIR